MGRYIKRHPHPVYTNMPGAYRAFPYTANALSLFVAARIGKSDRTSLSKRALQKKQGGHIRWTLFTQRDKI
jgi:hypothetical protein